MLAKIFYLIIFNFYFMLNFKLATKHYTNENICEYVFNKYLNDKIHQNSIDENNRVYDHLGMIDTLGYNSDRGCNHFSHSDEGGCIFGIRFLNKWYVYVNYNKPEVYIFPLNAITINNK